MNPLFNFIFLVEENQKAFNKRILAYIRAVKKMSIGELWAHRKHKHFSDLIYFWVANDYHDKNS